MFILRLIPVVTTLLFILLQEIDLRIIKREQLTVKINFNIFALVLISEKKSRKGKFKKLIKALPSIIKSANYLVSVSRITIRRFNEAKMKGSVNLAGNILSRTLILSYLHSKAKSVIHLQKPENNDIVPTEIDISLHFSIFDMINSALIFVYYNIKNKVRKVI